jgi:NADH-quinone oxidoreductase subunit N
MLQSLSNLASIGTPFIPGWRDLQPFIAELWLIVTIISVLITPFFARKPNAACAVVSLIGVALAFITLLASGGEEMVGSFLRGMLISDPLAILWKLMLLLFVAGIIWLWFTTTSRTMHEGDGPEFFTLLLGATLGMSMMASVSNLLMVFLTVELASLPSYVLAGFRKTHRVGAEASLKYVLFGAATSSIIA